jgi:predicted nucleic acid-binding protein
MRILIDTNVVLDRFLQRLPWYDEAQEFWGLIAAGQIIGYITGSMVTDIFYTARRPFGSRFALGIVRDCLDAFEVCTVDLKALEEALALSGVDYEDNLQIACARTAELDAIVTRDSAGFRGAPIPILTSVEAAERLRL